MRGVPASDVSVPPRLRHLLCVLLLAFRVPLQKNKNKKKRSPSAQATGPGRGSVAWGDGWRSQPASPAQPRGSRQARRRSVLRTGGARAPGVAVPDWRLRTVPGPRRAVTCAPRGCGPRPGLGGRPAAPSGGLRPRPTPSPPLAVSGRRLWGSGYALAPAAPGPGSPARPAAG